MPGEAQHSVAHDASEARREAPRQEGYSVRDYIRAMSQELAQMARWDGDEQLACVLEAAATLAQAGPERAVAAAAAEVERPS
jgi:hypothetical protein